MAEATDSSFDELAAAIYGVEPSRFIEERARLVKQLRDDGQRDLATRIGRLRKPTLPAWAVDQIVLHDGGLVDAVIAGGDSARAAQGAEDRRERQQALRTLHQQVAAARDRACEHLRRIDADPSAHVEEIEHTLMAVAVDPGRRPEVSRGTLTRPLPPPGFAALVDVDVAAGEQRTRDAPSARNETQEALRAARGELEDLQGREDRIARDAQRAERHARQLHDEADAADRAADALRRQLARLREDLEELRSRIAGLEQEGRPG